ncbi:MAG: TAXI family TRAP transporter solute-binding subunit [Chloroflexota bacterium]
MSRNLASLIVVTALLVSLLAGCAGGAPPPAPSPTPTPTTPATKPPTTPATTPTAAPWQWPKTINIISSGGVGLAAAVAWAAIMDKDTGMAIRVVDESNVLLRFKWVRDGSYFMGAYSADNADSQMRADEGYATRDNGPYEMRIVYVRSQIDSGYIVRGDSNIKTPYDLKKGVRIALTTADPIGKATFNGLLAWANLKEEDAVWVGAGSYAKKIAAVVNGQADITQAFTTSTDTFKAASSPHGIRYLDLPYDTDPEGAKRYLAIDPITDFGVMTTGVKEAHGVRSKAGIAMYCARADADPALVYNVVKWLDKNWDKYKDKHEWLLKQNMDVFMQGLSRWFIPVHDGAIKYLKEIGKWTPAHDARQKVNQALLTQWVKAYPEAIAKADAAKIDINPDNPAWVKLWHDYQKEKGLKRFQMFLGI